MNDPRKDAKLRQWVDPEKAAIALCHSDGWDYGEPYDDWPEAINDEEGLPWVDQAAARNHYREQANVAITAAFGYGAWGDSGIVTPWIVQTEAENDIRGE